MSKLFDDIKDLRDHEVEIALNRARPVKLPPRHAHPIVAGLPVVADYKKLVASIRSDGQQYAVAMHQGYIWEGRARYDACVEIGLVPKVFVLRENPIKFLLRRDYRRYATPADREALFERLSKLNGKDWEVKEEAYRKDWVSIERDIFRKLKKIKKPCAVCGLGKEYSHAHHLIPLSLQYDLGVTDASHEYECLCPVHHQLMHRMIGSMVTGSRVEYFSRSGGWLDKKKERESAAAFVVFDRGLALLSAIGGFPRAGNWHLIP